MIIWEDEDRRILLPHALIIGAILAVGVLMLVGPKRSDSGAVQLAYEGERREIRMEIGPTTINGQHRMPTWLELKQAYGLLDEDVEAAIRAHDRQWRTERASEQTEQIRERSQIVLRVE
jgi:hypothetical protein